MKLLYTVIFLMLLLPVGLLSCDAIEGIFKAGVWSGIIMVVGILILIVVVFYTLFRNKE